jgi:hypothetical protein
MKLAARWVGNFHNNPERMKNEALKVVAKYVPRGSKVEWKVVDPHGPKQHGELVITTSTEVINISTKGDIRVTPRRG